MRKKPNFKSLIIALVLIFAVPIFSGMAEILFNIKPQPSAFESYTQTQIYKKRVDKLAESVTFSNSYQNLYRSGETVNILNFMSVIRFKNEQEIMNQLSPYGNLTYFELLNKMFNDDNYYSVKKYYQVVSNGRLNLQTIFVNGQSSFEVQEFHRHDLVNKNLNGGVGYTPGKDYEITFFGNTFQLPIEEKYVLEYKLLDDVAINIKNYLQSNSVKEELDVDQDGFIDAFTVYLLPDDVNEGSPEIVDTSDWSGLLWPHSSQIAVEEIEQVISSTFGSSFASLAWNAVGINKNNFYYTFDQTTKKFGKYVLTTMDTKIHNSSYPYPKNNTEIHELGHLLGFPDFYVYTGNESTYTSVDVWDIMGTSHLDFAQYPLSYNREKMGWIDEQNIVKITQNGTYTLNPVNYEEVMGIPLSNRPIAYKIESPDYPGQAIMFEFRRQKENTFENNANYLMNGLLVYRVDDNLDQVFNIGNGITFKTPLTSAGNFFGPPFNVYVFRNDLTGTTNNYIESELATLNPINKGMGTGETYVWPQGSNKYGNSVARNITWQVYEGTNPNEINAEDVSYVNSGIKVEVISMNETQIVFSITWDGFSRQIERSEFESEILYNKLLELAGKSLQETLESKDLKNVQNLDLSNLGITSMKGFELLDFDNLKSLNLGGNSLSNFNEITNILNKNVNVKINLIANKFDLSSLTNQNLNNSSLYFGFQFYDLSNNNIIKFNELGFRVLYHWNQTQQNFTFLINGQEVQNDLNLKLYEAKTFGQHKFQILSNAGSEFNFETNLTITLISINLTQTNFEIERNSAFPSLNIDGISEGELEINVNSPVTSTENVTATFTIVWTVGVKGSAVTPYTVSKSYQIVDKQKPQINILGQAYIEVEKGTNLSELIPHPEIEIVDNGQTENYTFLTNITSGQTKVWTKKYYKVSFNFDDIILENEIPSLENLDLGFYVVLYKVVDVAGNESEAFRQIFITSAILTQSDIPDQNLYYSLLDLINSQNVYKNLLENHNYVDLSNKGIANLQGIENLNFKQNAIIDLSGNQIKSLNSLYNLLQNQPNIKSINLLFNQIETASTSNKIILGVQKLNKQKYLQKIEFVLFDDYSSEFNFKYNFGNQNKNLTVGKNTLTDLGTYTFEFISLGDHSSILKQVELGSVSIKQNPTIEAGSSNFNLNDFLVWKVVSLNDFTVEFYNQDELISPNQINLSATLGNKPIEVKIYDQSELIEKLNFVVEVKDTIAPTITLNGSQTLYLKKDSNYEEFSVSATDSFDPSPKIETVGSVDTQTPGVYKITYRATDASNNSSQIVERTIYVGEVTPKQNVLIDYQKSVSADVIFDFNVFNLTDFVVVVLQSYNSNILSTQTVRYRFTHKINNSIIYELTNQVKIVDREKPVISLIGPEVEYVYVNQTFTDKKAQVSDNYTIFTETISGEGSVNTSVVGEYYLTYNAVDENNNQAIPVQRKIVVLPLPIQVGMFTIERVNKSSNTPVGEWVEFKIDLSRIDENLYNHNSMFIWYVDGRAVESGEGKTTFKYKFDTAKQHVISVAVQNQLSTGEIETKQISQMPILISDEIFIVKYGPTIIFGTSGLIVLFIILSFVIKKKRRLY